MRGSQRADALATTCGARMRDGSRAPCLLRLCAPRFAHRTCTLYVLSSSSSSSAARHRTLEDSRDRHDLNQPEIHRVPRIREFYPRQPFLTNTIKKKGKKQRKKYRRLADRRPRIPVSISFEKNKIRKKPKRNVSTRLKDDSKESDKREKRRKRSRKIRANAKERRNEETNEQQQQQQQQLGD